MTTTAPTTASAQGTEEIVTTEGGASAVNVPQAGSSPGA